MNRLFYAICHRLALSQYFSKIKWSEEGVDPSMAADDMNEDYKVKNAPWRYSFDFDGSRAITACAILSLSFWLRGPHINRSSLLPRRTVIPE